MERVLGIATFVLGVGLLVIWPAGFIGAVVLNVVTCLGFGFVLKRAPRLSLPGLSEGAQLLVDEYNHAYSSPGLTRIARTLMNVGSMLSILGAVGFGIYGQWMIVAGLVGGLLAFTYLSGRFDPVGFIRRNDLGEESREVATAYMMRTWQGKPPPTSATHLDDRL